MTNAAHIGLLDTEDCPMDPEFRLDRFVANWLGPCLVVAAAMALGLALFASENRWGSTLAGPAVGVLTTSDGAATTHRGRR